MSTTYISYNDLAVRLKSLKCCLGTKGYTLTKKLEQGIDCVKEITDFNVANVAYNILSCTVTNLTAYDYSILPYVEGTILGKDLSSIFTDLRIQIPSESIDYRDSNLTIIAFLNDFIALYPDYSYTAVSTGVSVLFTVTGPCSVSLDTYIATVNSNTFTTNFTECNPNSYIYNNQNDANCLTVSQILSIFEYLEQYCCKCFPMYGELDNEPTITPI